VKLAEQVAELKDDAMEEKTRKRSARTGRCNEKEML
jgi:hypothetical protein